ncbi:hypothetical protein L218DRAFT_954171 [Marasmius fiardii PR-910]|nr:hypothetical protein L218DRAFT_954171 [Marasmius fiardii PR-910]
MPHGRIKSNDKTRKKPGTMKIQGLTKLVTSVSFLQDEGNGEKLVESSKRIYTHLLDNKFLRKVSEGNDRIPPLELLTYAIRDILFPSFLGPCRIPDVLDLLSNVEHYRCVCKEKAGKAVVYDEFYSFSDRKAILLSKEERSSLDDIGEQASPLRARFLNLLLNYTQLDIHYLCTSPSRLPGMQEHMEEDFGDRLSFPFYAILTQEEQQHFTEMVEQLLRNSMKLVCDAQKREISLDGKDAQELFPCPVAIEQLVDSTDSYLRAVETQTSALKAIFPT